MMKKFLNFSTILFSYLLITVLVISCGGSSGGGGGTGSAGNGGNGGDGGGSLPQADLNDKSCLLSDRDDKDAVVAVLCQGDSFIGLITKTTPAGQDAQQITPLIPSTASTAGSNTSRTWDLSTGVQIQISYDKDYTLTVDEPTEGASQLGALSDAAEHTAEFPLQNLTASLLNDTKEALTSGGITFSPASGSAIKVAIETKLGVKTQQDFISIGRFTSTPLGGINSPLLYVLENDLDLVAPGGEGAKFGDSIIPIADASFDFDGDGHTITLNSGIDTTAANKSAGIIGKVTKGISFSDVTLNINAPISGNSNVGAILGYGEAGAISNIINSKVNINKNITVYKSADDENGHAGGAVGNGCVHIDNVVVKTADNVSIRAAAKDYGAKFTAKIGGLAGRAHCADGLYEVIKNNVVDVAIGGYAAADTAPNNTFYIGGLASTIDNMPEISNNLVKLAIYKDAKLPADFVFEFLAGFVQYAEFLKLAENNLVYVDFSNIGSVNYVGGLFGKLANTVTDNNIANNMVFIADGFTGSEVLSNFGAAIQFYYLVGFDPRSLNIANIFVSSPVTDEQYNNHSNLSSFVYKSGSYMNFDNLILDNKDAAVMFREEGTDNYLKGEVPSSALSTLAEAKGANSSGGIIFRVKTSDSWEVGSQDYPQLKAPADLTGSVTKADIAQAWTATNQDIQTKLAARANK